MGRVVRVKEQKESNLKSKKGEEYDCKEFMHRFILTKSPRAGLTTDNFITLHYKYFVGL